MVGKITIDEIARAAKALIVPPGGGWVCIKGNPGTLRAPLRGTDRLPRAVVALGVQHMDIFWAINEELVVWGNSRHKGFIRKKLRDLNRPRKYDLSRDGLVQDGAEWYYGFCERAGWSHRQRSLITIDGPWSETVRFYNGEVAVYSQELIDTLLEEDQVEAHVFGVTGHPVFEETIRDLVDALQIDGLSYHQAYNELLRAGEVEGDSMSPGVFYRPINWFRAQFVED